MKLPLAKRRELVIVLSSLFVFSSFLTLVNSFSSHTEGESMHTQVAVEQLQEGVLDLYSPKEALAFVNDLVESRSVEKIVTLLDGVKSERLVQLLSLVGQKVDRGTTNFDSMDLYQLYGGAALVYKDNEAYMDDLVKSLLGLKSFYQEPFLYVVGVHPEYHTALASFVTAFQRAGIDLNKMMLQAEKRVAATKSPQRLALFLSNPLPFNAETKKQLVWDVVMIGAAESIGVLKQHDFDLNVVDQGKTPLVQAVINNDEAMVRALLKAGVTVNTIANDAIGSALQRALVTKNLPIELLLREYGAHE